MNNNEEMIEFFKEMMQEQLGAIEKLSAPKHETLFKKKLYISFLESLAKAAFPEELVKQRFMNFLKNYTEWDECDYCCPVVLNDKEKIQNILKSDELYTKIEDVAMFKEDSYDYKCTYSYLLYEARNSMVHQLQSATEWEVAINRRGIESPFYQIIEIQGHDDESWLGLKTVKKQIELVFPNTFLKNLSEVGLENFIQYCKDEQINPFVNYYAERIIYEEEI